MLKKAMDREEFFDRQKLKDIVQTYKYLNKELLSVVEKLMVDEFGKKEEFQRWKFDILMQQQNLSKSEEGNMFMNMMQILDQNLG